METNTEVISFNFCTLEVIFLGFATLDTLLVIGFCRSGELVFMLIGATGCGRKVDNGEVAREGIIGLATGETERLRGDVGLVIGDTIGVICGLAMSLGSRVDFKSC